MKNKARERHINLGKEFLDLAVDQRGNLGPHKFLYKLTHVNILNQRKRRRLIGRSCGGIGCNGLPLARHGGECYSAVGRSKNKVGSMAKGIAVGFPTTVVARVAVR